MIFLAIRYLLARRKQTILTLLGIFFGTAAYVALSGFLLGFRGYLLDQLINNSAHIHIQAREDFLSRHSLDQAFFGKSYQHIFWSSPPSGRKDAAIVENPQQWYQRLNSDPRVAAYSPQLTSAVIFTKGKAQATATLTGCDPLQQVRVTTIGEYITEGRWEDLAAGGNRLVIGAELAKKLGVEVSQNVWVALGKGTPTPFKVVAVFTVGNKMNDSQAFGALADVQRINRTPNQVNEIAVKLHDYTQSAQIATDWSKISQEKIESWDQQNANLFDVFRLQDSIRFVTIGAILIVAGFGIYNVLNMTVIQKRRDIAILRSMGYGSGDVITLFFSQGLFLGFSGAILGLIFGYFFCLYLETIPFGGPMGAGPGHLIISLDPWLYAQAGAFSIASAVLASILPARAAGKLTPIDIIRAGAE